MKLSTTEKGFLLGALRLLIDEVRDEEFELTGDNASFWHGIYHSADYVYYDDVELQHADEDLAKKLADLTRR